MLNRLYRDWIRRREGPEPTPEMIEIDKRHDRLLDEAKKLLIISSFEKLDFTSKSTIKKSVKDSEPLANVILSNGKAMRLNNYYMKTVQVDNILSLEKKEHLIIDFYNDFHDEMKISVISELERAFHYFNVGERKSTYETDLSRARKLCGVSNDIFMDPDKGFIKYGKIIDYNESTNFVKNHVSKVRNLKLQAIKLKEEQNMTIEQISNVLPLTKNQIKNAITNKNRYKDLEWLHENRGIHKRMNSIRTVKNIEWIKNCLISTDTPMTVKDVQKRFEDEIVGRKISRSLVYQIIKEDCNMKYGIPKRNHANKNSDNNKSYRIHIIRTIAARMLDDHLFVSIDETGFSDYISKIKIWHDTNDSSKMVLKQKTQSITFSLLLAATQDHVIGYYIVEGAVNSVIYRSFLKNMYNKVWPYIRRQGKITVLMDNARIHKSSFVKDYMVQMKDVNFIYMPAYSPEINFIENIFNRIKQRFNKLPQSNSK